MMTKLLNIPFLRDVVALRRDIHAHPEMAFQETRTSDLVARELTRYGVEVHRGLAQTGVLGVLRQGRGARAIGLRADMDALPLSEKNRFAHCSQHARTMHACGHDGHTAILLGAARYLAENRAALNFDGTLYFIFQPAEEAEGGAEVMIREGLFTRFPMDAVYGLHNWPGIPAGEMSVSAGPVMAGTCEFEIRVSGHGCHAAMPYQGVDTLVVASQLVLALQTIVARKLHPCDPAVISVTQIHGGEALNIIPDTVALRGTIRCFKREVQEKIEQAIECLCTGIATAFGAKIEASFNPGYPPTVNSPAETAQCQRAAESLLGEGKLRTADAPSMGGEDFAFMLQEKPGCYVWLGNGETSGGCTLHNPYYDFNDEIIPLGISYWVRLVETVLKSE